MSISTSDIAMYMQISFILTFLLAVIECPSFVVAPPMTKSTEMTTFGTNVVLTCPPGYKFPDGSNLRSTTCVEGGQWDGQIPERCAGKWVSYWVCFNSCIAVMVLCLLSYGHTIVVS